MSDPILNDVESLLANGRKAMYTNERLATVELGAVTISFDRLVQAVWDGICVDERHVPAGHLCERQAIQLEQAASEIRRRLPRASVPDHLDARTYE